MTDKTKTTDDYLSLERPGVLSFGGARMALLDLEAGFWGLRRQMEALVGPRLTDLALQQAGANGGASFARPFLDSSPEPDGAEALRACLAAYQAAGFGRFEIEALDWPPTRAKGGPGGRVVIRGQDTFEAWASSRHGKIEQRPICAYTAGVLVGFVNALTGRGDVACIEHACQACGDPDCRFELLPASQVQADTVVSLDPDPFLSKQLNLLEMLFDRMPMGIAILDRQLTLRRVNPTWAAFIERYTPYPGARATPGVNLFDLEPGTEGTLVPLFERVFGGETVRQEAVRLETGGIESFWDIVLAPLYEDGRVVGILNVSLDATPRVQALHRLEGALDTLQEREARLNLVLQGNRDGIWDWDLRTGQVYFSARWKAMLGYEESELKNELKTWRSRIHPRDRQRSRQAVEDFLAGRTEVYHLEHRLRHRDGSYRWILARGTALRDEAGRPYRLAGSHSDITEQKQVEASLQRRAEFETLVTSISTSFINLPLDEIDAGIQQALQRIGEFTRMDRSYVFQFSGDRATMDCTHEWAAPGIEPQLQDLQQVPVQDFAWSNQQLMAGQVLHIPRVADLPPEADVERVEFLRQQICSLIAVPMRYRGEPVGFLGFDSVRREKRWAEADVRLLQIVGEIFVNALEHKRAQAIQMGQRQFLELLATGGNFSAILHSLVKIIEEQWPGMQGLVLLLDKGRARLHLGAAVSLPQDYLDSIEGLEIGPRVGSCGTASYTGQRVIVEDILTDRRWDGLRELAARHGLRACWSEPVLDQDGRVVGTFAMYYRRPRAPTPAELRTIETAAHLVGVAIEHRDARQALLEAYQTMEQRVAARTHELSTLLEASRTVAATLELEPVVNLILDQLNEVVEFDGASIWTLVDDSLSVLAYRGPIPEDRALQVQYPLAEAGANRAVIEAREPLIIPDVLEQDPLADEFRRTAGGELDTTFAYIRSWMGVPLIVKDQVIGMLSLDHRKPGFYSAEAGELALAFAAQVAVAVENARLYQQEQSQRRESERRRQVAEGLREVLAVLNSDRPVDEVLALILAQARRLLGAEAARLERLVGPEGLLRIQATDGPRPARSAVAADAARQVVTAGRPVLVQNAAGRSEEGVSGQPGGADQALLSVPLFIGGEPDGALTLYYCQSRSFRAEEVELAATFAEQATLAIENARLRDQAEEIAVAAERSRLARDLHDAVTQTLFSTSLIAEVLPRLWDKDPAEGRRRLEEIRELTRGALAEMRTLLLELRPAALADAEISDLLRQLVDAFTGRARLPVTLQVEGSHPLPLELKVAVYRIAQEALNNVAKHAEANLAAVTLRAGSDDGFLEIRDDGRGFPGLPDSADHLGIGIMQERAEGVGGQLAISSRPGEGTTVTFRWAIPDEEQEL